MISRKLGARVEFDIIHWSKTSSAFGQFERQCWKFVLTFDNWRKRKPRDQFIHPRLQKIDQNALQCQVTFGFWGKGSASPQLNDNALMLFMCPCSRVLIERSKFTALLWGWSKSFWEMWGSRSRSGRGGSRGKWVHEKKSKLQHSITEQPVGCLSITDWFILDSERFELGWEQPPFSMEILPGPAFTDLEQWWRALQTYHYMVQREEEEGGSAWILLPAGSTSFPLDCSLNAATDFKDIWLHCHSQGMKLYFLSPGYSGKKIPPNLSIRLDFLAR